MPRVATTFVDPPWEAVLAVERCIAEIPDTATIAGMFYLALQEGAKRRNVELPFPKQRFVPFGFYPLREFARALVQASRSFYPNRSLRQGLRAIGTAGPKAFAASTLGKVTFGSAGGVQEAVAAIAKTYSANIHPARCTIVESAPRAMQLSFDHVYHFLDSHHVGVFEGIFEHLGVQGRVRIAMTSLSSGTFLLEW